MPRLSGVGVAPFGEKDEHLTWKCSHHLGDIGVGMLGMEFEQLSIER